MALLDLLLSFLGLPLLAACGYLFTLTLLSRERPPPASKAPRLKFDFVVPAHNEEAGIADTVANLTQVDYPEALRRVLVVADNCTDQTAARAQAAGATVLLRTHEKERGKGYALAHAFEASRKDGFADAVVVVDADTVVSPNLLKAFSARLEQGAQAAQAHYGVRNPGASWRTRLMSIALAIFHGLRSLGRERLGVSCGLRGNGMCFTAQVLRQVPHDAFSVVEDLEYGIQLGLAGHRVHFVGEAHVRGEMVSQEKASRSQRRRWEDGRAQIRKSHGGPLLAKGLGKLDPLLLDLAMDVLVPPLSFLAGWALLGTLLAGLLSWADGTTFVALYLFLLCDLMLTAYVLRGWQLSKTGARGLFDLLLAPVYMVWKVTLLARRSEHRKDEWVRTTRESEPR